jgi:hypothetical protein
MVERRRLSLPPSLQEEEGIMSGLEPKSPVRKTQDVGS